MVVGNRHFIPSGLHKLEHGGLPQYMLENDPVGAYLKIALSSDHLLILRIVQVGERILSARVNGRSSFFHTIRRFCFMAEIRTNPRLFLFDSSANLATVGQRTDEIDDQLCAC